MARLACLSSVKGIVLSSVGALVFLVSLHHGLTKVGKGANGRKKSYDAGSSGDIDEQFAENASSMRTRLFTGYRDKKSDGAPAVNGSRSTNSSPATNASKGYALKIRTKKSTEKDGRCLGIFVNDCAEESNHCGEFYTSVPSSEPGNELFKQCGEQRNARGILNQGSCQVGKACTGRALRCSWKCMGIADYGLVFPSSEFFGWYDASRTDMDVCMYRADLECAKLLPAAVKAQVHHAHESKNPTPKEAMRAKTGGRGCVDASGAYSGGCSAQLMDELPTKKHGNVVSHVKVDARMRATSQEELQKQIRKHY